jgi:hypothetical protein
LNLSPSKIQNIIEGIDRKSGKNLEKMQNDLNKIYMMQVKNGQDGSKPGADNLGHKRPYNDQQQYGTPPNRG